MKLYTNIQSHPRVASISAFTLVEMMISVGIYLIIFIGVMVAIQIFALRVYTLASTKLTATQMGREALNYVRTDIQQAKTLQIGTLTTAGDGSTFVAITNTSSAQGGALQIFFTTNPVPYTTYYLDTTTAANYHLMQYLVDSNSVVTTNDLVDYITNTVVFNAEDFQGNLITNSLVNNQIYHMVLQFSQWEYPIAYISSNHTSLNAYDYFQLRTRVCRRALD